MGTQVGPIICGELHRCFPGQSRAVAGRALVILYDCKMHLGNNYQVTLKNKSCYILEGTWHTQGHAERLRRERDKEGE